MKEFLFINSKYKQPLPASQLATAPPLLKAASDMHLWPPRPSPQAACSPSSPRQGEGGRAQPQHGLGGKQQRFEAAGPLWVFSGVTAARRLVLHLKGGILENY